LCFSAADAENLMQRLRAVGAEGQPLAVRQARALEPGISPRAESAWLFGDDARVDNAGLTAAYARAAGAVGCEIREGETVDRVAVERGRVVGVETRAGRIACDAFVNAAGAWAGSLAAGLGIPVTPVRGQMVVLNTRQPAFRHAIYSRRGYAVTRRDGRLLLGSTREPVGFDRRVTGGGVRRIVGAALELSPQLGTAPLQECWSGLRPATPDGLPIIGFDPTVTGYMVASGHYRNGILLAPITAQLVADLFRGRTDPIMAHIGLDRFQSGPIGADD
jgi:thiazole synthase